MGNLFSKRSRQTQTGNEDADSKALKPKFDTTQKKKPDLKDNAIDHHSASPTLSASSATPTNNEASPGTTLLPDQKPFTLLDKSIDEPRPFKVICIGAGYSGIMCGIRYDHTDIMPGYYSELRGDRFQQRMKNLNLTIYERNAGIGRLISRNGGDRL